MPLYYHGMCLRCDRIKIIKHALSDRHHGEGRSIIVRDECECRDSCMRFQGVNVVDGVMAAFDERQEE